MTPDRQEEIDLRWAAIDKSLGDIQAGKVMPDVDDIAKYEEQLLDEQDKLEYELGEAYFDERDKETT